MKLNPKAFEQAKSLVQEGKVNKESDWSEAQPSATDENEFLERAGWESYAKWFLSIDPEAAEQTKERYGFPYGDFDTLHRSGLIAAKQRAGQYDYQEIQEAIDELIIQIDHEADAVSKASEQSFPASDPPSWSG